MPISYSAPMPPWVGQPADPAAHYQAGFQMGTHLGAQQAAQMFQQQQMARELQKDEFERQSQSLAMQMKVEEATAQHRANFAYQNMIARGVDPMQALQMIGPDMGVDPSRLIAMQQQREARQMTQAGLNERLNRQLELRRELAQQSAEKATTQQKERQDYADLYGKVQSLTQQSQAAPGDLKVKEDLNRATAMLEAWEKQHPGGRELSLTTDPSGGITLSMGTGKIQPGAASLVQREIADLKNSIVQTDQIRSKLTEKDIGVSGYVWDEVVNKWIAQIAEQSGDPTVSANRVQLQKAADSYLQTQTAKGRLSSAEREDIRNALVTRKPGESFVRAQAVLDAMSRIQKFDAISKAKTIKQPLEGWMFQGLSQTEIAQLLREQVLTPAEALTWAKQATRR